jgi:hypothetical protein
LLCFRLSVPPGRWRQLPGFLRGAAEHLAHSLVDVQDRPGLGVMDQDGIIQGIENCPVIGPVNLHGWACPRIFHYSILLGEQGIVNFCLLLNLIIFSSEIKTMLEARH